MIAPGDVIILNNNYHDGVRLVLKEQVPLFVVAVFDERTVGWDKSDSGLTRSPERILVMPAGVCRLYDLQRRWIEMNCKRLTSWQTRSPV